MNGWEPLDRALASYRSGEVGAAVLMRTDVGGVEEVPVSLFFRSETEMGALERTALSLATGRILDVGAGPGALASPLMAAGRAVTALEVLPAARAALRERGVDDVREGGLEVLAPGERFDTVLVLMNGLGLAGALDGLTAFLSALAGALDDGGRILADSTDPLGWGEPEDGRYPGEVHMQLGFDGVWGEPFPFLFVDAATLREHARSALLETEILAEEDDGRYLARFTRARPAPTP